MLRERRTNITSQLLWVGFRRKFVSFNRRARVNGKPPWTLGKRLRLFTDTIFAFSPLATTFINSYLGALTVLVTGLWMNKDSSHFFLGVSVSVVLLGALVQHGFITRLWDEARRRPLFEFEA